MMIRRIGNDASSRIGALMTVAGAVAMALIAQSATAQNCANPVTQLDLNQCADQRFQAADAALNAQWPVAMNYARSFGAHEDLRAAQRQWIAYRDAACQVQISPYAGGSIVPLVYSECLTELTNQRTRMLIDFSAP